MAPAAFHRAPETYPLLGCLAPQDRIVITGASGWLGRSLLHELEAALGDRLAEQVLALGSTDRQIRLGSGRPIRIHAWEHELVADWQPTSAVHLAYLTRDHAADSSLSTYLEANLRLTAQAARLMHLPGIRSFVTASSGAAIDIDWAEAIGPAGAYGALKRLDEDFFIAEGARLGVPTVIARTWSVSGPYCTKPALFAFSDFIQQALSSGVITVRATGEVWRRYVDAGQYLALCLRSSGDGSPATIDSAGPLIEMRDLAAQCARELGARAVWDAPDPAVRPNRYATDSAALARLATAYGITLLGIDEQIAFTALGLASNWPSGTDPPGR